MCARAGVSDYAVPAGLAAYARAAAAAVPSSSAAMAASQRAPAHDPWDSGHGGLGMGVDISLRDYGLAMGIPSASTSGTSAMPPSMTPSSGLGAAGSSYAPHGSSVPRASSTADAGGVQAHGGAGAAAPAQAISHASSR